MSRRDMLRARALETVEALECGHYLDGEGRVVDIAEAVAAARTRTTLHDLGALARGAAASPRGRPGAIAVANETTLAGARALGAERGAPVCCLVFASARNPGGGFLRGSDAQEEAIARSSALSACLAAQPAFYEANRSCGTALYSDLAILARDVPVIRDDAERFVATPWTVSMIVAPAPNASAVRRNEPERAREIDNVSARRIAGVLALAGEAGHRRLVLGAWGCGVFGGDPAEVARLFGEALDAAGPAFEQVRFSVLDRPDGETIGAFRRRFG